MSRRHTITLFRHRGVYVARFTDPSVLRAFGQDTLPTAFTDGADPLDVVRETAAAYPEADVVLGRACPRTGPVQTARTSFRTGPSVN